jgi:hypothetical protein
VLPDQLEHLHIAPVCLLEVGTNVVGRRRRHGLVLLAEVEVSTGAIELRVLKGKRLLFGDPAKSGKM